MKWTKGDAYYIKSDCGLFHIGKATVMGKLYYELWCKGETWERVSAHASADEAKQACLNLLTPR